METVPPKSDYSLLQEVPTINLWLRIFWFYKGVITYESWGRLLEAWLALTVG